MLNNLIKKLASDCMMKNCLDEYVEVNWLKREVNLVDWYKDKTVYEW